MNRSGRAVLAVLRKHGAITRESIHTKVYFAASMSASDCDAAIDRCVQAGRLVVVTRPGEKPAWDYICLA